MIGGRNMDTKSNRQVGDTLVEVSIAITVLGVMLAASMAAINRSLLAVMNAAERTAVRSQIDSQAELLRYAWNKNINIKLGSTETTLRQAVRNRYIGNNNGTVNSEARKCGVEYGDDANGGGSFWLQTNNSASGEKNAVKFIGSHTQTGGWGSGIPPKPVAEYVSGTPVASQDGTVRGVWIDAYSPAPTGGAWYIDFYIRACWTPYGSPTTGSGRMQTVVRFRYSGQADEDLI